MRTLEQIKREIEDSFMRHQPAAGHYKFDTEKPKPFSHYFSKVSLENILFHIVACAVYGCEKLFGWHRQDIDALIAASKPHRAEWYRTKALGFMNGVELEKESDRYDTEGMTEEQIAEALVVKHCVVVEAADDSLITIKVAGEKQSDDPDVEGMVRCTLDELEQDEGDPDEAQGDGEVKPGVTKRLEAYMKQIKDAGVKLVVRSDYPESFGCLGTIYYDPMYDEEAVKKNCVAAIREYLQNLDFNGEYSNMALVDVLQKVEGVKIPHIESTWYTAPGEDIGVSIDVRYTPSAGWFIIDKGEEEIDLTMASYEKV